MAWTRETKVARLLVRYKDAVELRCELRSKPEEQRTEEERAKYREADRRCNMLRSTMYRIMMASTADLG